jgi:tripartite-type tricarboxylate transporter receptor subunit TctC
MKFPRRRFLHLAAGAAALPAVSRIARAQSYPTRPVRIVVPSGAGGTPDIYARLVGPWLSVRLGQSFVIENRAGGSGNIGTEVVVRAAPDGYTLLLVTPNNAINVTLYNKLNFNFRRDIAPVGSITRQSEVMLVNPSVPAKTLPEFIAYAKAHPGKISMASAGTGTPPHLAGELLKKMAGIDMVHVPYRGGASAMTDLIGGQVQVQFTTTISSGEAFPTAPVPTSLLPCWVQPPPLRVKTHAAPVYDLSPTPPTMAVPSADSATEEPCRAVAIARVPTIFG